MISEPPATNTTTPKTAVAIVTVPRHTVPLTSKVLRQDNSTPAPRAAVSHTDLHVPVSHTSTEHRNAPSTPPSGPDSGLLHRSPLAMPPRLHVSARAGEDHDREKARKAATGPCPTREQREAQQRP